MIQYHITRSHDPICTVQQDTLTFLLVFPRQQMDGYKQVVLTTWSLAGRPGDCLRPFLTTALDNQEWPGTAQSLEVD